jgi:hypothetical protein
MFQWCETRQRGSACNSALASAPGAAAVLNVQQGGLACTEVAVTWSTADESVGVVMSAVKWLGSEAQPTILHSLRRLAQLRPQVCRRELSPRMYHGRRCDAAALGAGAGMPRSRAARASCRRSSFRRAASQASMHCAHASLANLKLTTWPWHRCHARPVTAYILLVLVDCMLATVATWPGPPAECDGRQKPMSQPQGSDMATCTTHHGRHKLRRASYGLKVYCRRAAPKPEPTAAQTSAATMLDMPSPAGGGARLAGPAPVVLCQAFG